MRIFFTIIFYNPHATIYVFLISTFVKVTPMTLTTTADKMSWSCLPADIRILVLEVLQQDGCGLAAFATVSREWQMIIEQQNFARIKLTPSCLADFGAMIYRNRALVSYIWLCLELPEYDCLQSLHGEMSDTENALITTAFEDIFSTLSTWEPNGTLLLDISLHSPSDSEHYFNI